VRGDNYICRLRTSSLAQDALVVALSEWPRSGVPANAGAWLMTVAKRRAVDAFRRDKMPELNVRQDRMRAQLRPLDRGLRDSVGLPVSWAPGSPDNDVFLAEKTCRINIPYRVATWPLSCG
jgi:DNA-directed RNA polymerase specialized sigma24 family protein